MGEWWLTVFVLLCVPNVFANICDKDEYTSCDECIRCGKSWCPDPKQNSHCIAFQTDDFCDVKTEPRNIHDEKEKKDLVGDLLNPVYSEKRILSADRHTMTFTYQSSKLLKVVASLVNSTQNNHVDVYVDSSIAQCSSTSNECSVSLEVKVFNSYCSQNSSYEHFLVKIKVENITEEAFIKYNVTCMCSCSKNKVEKSPICSGHGAYACGACDCYDGWSGPKCNTKVPDSSGYDIGLGPISIINVNFDRMSPKCNFHGDFLDGICHCYEERTGPTCDDLQGCQTDGRGDLACANPAMSAVECSGNGYCGRCDTCECYNDREGYQYFDPKNYCSDICIDTSLCESCLYNNTVEPCESHSAQCQLITKLQYNATMAAQRDQHKRKIWASCNDTITLANNETCFVKYVAMKTDDSKIKVMIVESCHNKTKRGLVAAAGESNLSLILGVIFAVLAVAAITGVVLWKYFGSNPQLPLAESQYQNIDAEDSTGVNPLYIPPMSEYKNPIYGNNKC